MRKARVVGLSSSSLRTLDSCSVPETLFTQRFSLYPHLPNISDGFAIVWCTVPCMNDDFTILWTSTPAYLSRNGIWSEIQLGSITLPLVYCISSSTTPMLP